MTNEIDLIDTFNGWQFLANVGALVCLALLPYLVYIVALILQ